MVLRKALYSVHCRRTFQESLLGTLVVTSLVRKRAIPIVFKDTIRKLRSNGLQWTSSVKDIDVAKKLAHGRLLSQSYTIY